MTPNTWRKSQPYMGGAGSSEGSSQPGSKGVAVLCGLQGSVPGQGEGKELSGKMNK